MRNFIHSAKYLLLAGFMALTQAACDLRMTVIPEPTADSYPNAFRIEQRVQGQIARINQGFNTGALEPRMVQGLTETDDMVRALARRYRAANPSMDLDVSSTAFLDSLLNGNNLAISDALENRQDWVYAFDNDFDYDYGYQPDRLLYITVLQYRLQQQEMGIKSAIQSGTLTPDQAGEAKDRLHSVRETEISDFRLNGKLDLGPNQILELGQMADDSGHFIHFLAQGGGGGGLGPRENGYALNNQAAPNANVFAPNQNMPSQSNPNPQGTNRLWDGRAVNAQAQSPQKTTPQNPASNGGQWNPKNPSNGSPLPAPAFTATPVPRLPIQPINQAPAPPPTPTPAPVAPINPPSQGSAGANPRLSATGSSVLSPGLLPLDLLKARDKQLDQLYQSTQQRKPAPDLTAVNQKRQAFHQALKGFIQQNGQKGVNPSQLSQLFKLLDDYSSALNNVPKAAQSSTAGGPGQAPPTGGNQPKQP